MTPAQHAAYLAVCAADPDCRCPHVYFDGHAGLGAGAWRDTEDAPVAIPVAVATITDHLHTRLESVNHTFMGYDGPDIEVSLEGASGWLCYATAKFGGGVYCKSKLSAYLAAHVIRLNLDRALIRALVHADTQDSTA